MSFDDLLALLGLDGESRTVLVVEDHVGLLRSLVEVLEDQGHRVIGLLGIRHIEEGRATGPGFAGEESFSLREIDAAFLDHYFLSDRHNGRTLTAALRQFGEAKILGMSSSAAANEAMRRAGANEAVVKSDLLRIVG